LSVFYKHEAQFEKWLQGELLHLLDANAARLGIERIVNEVKVPGGQIDLSVHFGDGSAAWIELKHWHIGRQKGSLWRVADCMGCVDAFGLTKDVQELTTGGRLGSGFAWLLFTANPGVEDWMRGVAAFNRRSAPLHV